MWVFSSAPLFLTEMGHARRRRRPERLAEKLLHIREALGLSQREIAGQVGIHRSHHHISKYERDKSIPFMEVLLAYARVANVTLEQLIDDELTLDL
jgi:transcriptional regulator with XRE-family HTH domain